MTLGIIEHSATQNTPAVYADPEQGSLSMSGDSYPENSFEFFSPIIDWIEARLAAAEPLRLELRLAYMNTSSVKALMDILDMMEEAHLAGQPVSLRWYYDPRNERLVEMIEEFREDCTFSFEVLPEPAQ